MSKERPFLTFSDFFEVLGGYEITPEDTIYIIVDGDKCRKARHDLHEVPLRVPYNDQIIIADGQYCRTCRQIQIQRNKFVELNNEYGEPSCKTLLKGLDDIRDNELAVDYSGYLDREFKERASESKLHKIGYSVASDSGLSTLQRQKLLQDAIEARVVSKGYVKSYLEHIIQINGKKSNNREALEKWKADLEFVINL